MKWFRLDSDLPQHHKIHQLVDLTGATEDAVLAAVVRLFSWVAQQREDGHLGDLTDSKIRAVTRCNAMSISALSEVRLIVENGEGWELRGWSERQPLLKMQQRVKRHRDATVTLPKRDGNVTVRATRHNTTDTAVVTTPVSPDHGNSSGESKDSPSLVGARPIDFPVKDGKPWTADPDKIAEWREAYPRLRVLEELARARQWLRDNPDRRKTPRGMTRFIGAWLSRAAERADSEAPQVTDTLEKLDYWQRVAEKAARNGNDLLAKQAKDEIEKIRRRSR